MSKSIATLHAVRHWEKSLTAAWPADETHPQDEWVIGAIDEDGNKYEVITVDAYQYDAPGASEKIARALIALWAQAFSEQQPDNHVEEVRTLVEPAPAQDERELPAPDITTKHGYPAYSVELVSRLLCTHPAQTEHQWPTAYPHEAMDKLATDRYRVGSAGAGTLHRYAVRAGDGEQELYRGSESDCQNVARKLAGAFLDGGLAFQAMLAAPIAQTAPQPDQSGLLEAITPEVIDWVRCGLSVNGRLVDGSHPALEKLCAAYRAALSAQRR
ncbi:hypothetical protein [Stutzerimonas nitrititolerans]|uniref:hypothetical protein n=1 Tax=Stutzerimonas nitrititolerans TaxID=2482751 RepID=UPI0028B1FFA3|nr:hypothetical protein [Stutzerimonas nitrititolerans]